MDSSLPPDSASESTAESQSSRPNGPGRSPKQGPDRHEIGQRTSDRWRAYLRDLLRND